MRLQTRAFGLVDLAGAVVMLGFGGLAVVGVLHDCKRVTRRQRCADQLKGIGTSSKIYANENNEKWMIPTFSNQALFDGDGIDYLNHDGTTRPPNTDPGEVGYEREFQSTSYTGTPGVGGSAAVSTTRAFWILVRSGGVTVEQFVCPSSRDVPDPTEDEDPSLDEFYDFTGYANVSYGYQVPFGPGDTRPREGGDNRMVLAADKGPFYTDRFDPSFTTWRGEPLDLDSPHVQWRWYNSPNHHRQGQNAVCGRARGI